MSAEVSKCPRPSRVPGARKCFAWKPVATSLSRIVFDAPYPLSVAVRRRMGAERPGIPQRTGPPATDRRTFLRDVRAEETETGVQVVPKRSPRAVPGAAPRQWVQLLRVGRQQSHT